MDTEAASLFRETALCKGDFIKDLQALPGPKPSRMRLFWILPAGFSSSAMRSSGIHALAIAPHKNALAVAPTPDAIRSGQYPMAFMKEQILETPYTL